jgi:hypothetical protein
LLSLSPSSSTREEEAQAHTVRESSTHKKTPPGSVGVSPYKLPSLSLERTSQRSVGQVSWLAAAIYFLRLPKAMCLSGLSRFRSAHSCGAAMELHHLPWLRSKTVTNPTSSVFNSEAELTADCPALSRTFLQRARVLCISNGAWTERGLYSKRFAATSPTEGLRQRQSNA